jgi:hypothetical protein
MGKGWAFQNELSRRIIKPKLNTIMNNKIFFSNCTKKFKNGMASN